MCQELGIHIDLDKNVEEIELGDFAEEIDAMDWMLTHQLSSKNLTPGEKLAMMDEFKEEVRKENEKKKLDGNKLGANITNGKTVSLQLEAERGDIGGFTKKTGRRIKVLERIYGIEHGKNQRTSNNYKSSKSQEQLAKKYNVTQQTMNNYMRLAKAIPELEDLENTDICDKTIAIFIRL